MAQSRYIYENFPSETFKSSRNPQVLRDCAISHNKEGEKRCWKGREREKGLENGLKSKNPEKKGQNQGAERNKWAGKRRSGGWIADCSRKKSRCGPWWRGKRLCADAWKRPLRNPPLKSSHRSGGPGTFGMGRVASRTKRARLRDERQDVAQEGGLGGIGQAKTRHALELSAGLVGIASFGIGEPSKTQIPAGGTDLQVTSQADGTIGQAQGGGEGKAQRSLGVLIGAADGAGSQSGED